MSWSAGRVLLWSVACLNVVYVGCTSVSASSDRTVSPTRTTPGTSSAVPGDSEVPDLPPSLCPKKLRACWHESPPYLIKGASNVTGVFKDVLDEILGKCCNSSGQTPLVEFADDGGLNCTSPDLILPRDQKKECPGWFVNVVQSPGIALVLNRKKLLREAQENVWVEIFQLWTVLVLALILASISGIVIWTLDTFSQRQTFPAEFPRGATEGIWWAFVTMTTVGYGDKIPKSLCARVFAVVWMFVGLSLMSLLTATMTSALTLGQVRNTAEIFNKNIGVLEHGQGYKEGIDRGASVTKFPTLNKLYVALVDGEIDGIMLDVFKASYRANRIPDKDLVVSKIFEFPFALGVCVPMADLMEEQPYVSCMEDKGKTIFQAEVYDTVRKYVQATSLKGMEASKAKSDSLQVELNLFHDESTFYLMLKILGGILVILVFLGFLYEAFVCRRRGSHAFRRGRQDAASHQLHETATEVEQLIANISELENSLLKVSQVKELCHKLKADLECSAKKKNKSRATKNAHPLLEMNACGHTRMENYRTG